jgi:hypothetical protein
MGLPQSEIDKAEEAVDAIEQYNRQATKFVTFATAGNFRTREQRLELAIHEIRRRLAVNDIEGIRKVLHGLGEV